MGQEKRIALIFTYNEAWIGGTYYILNLIHALNSIPAEDKPYITIVCEKKSDFEFVQTETRYSKLDFHYIKEVKYSIFERIINKYYRTFLGKNKIEKQLPDKFDLVFPNPDGHFFSKINTNNKAYWIPDFQEDYYPHFFPEDELMSRKQYHIYVAVKTKKLILSSKSAQKDFNQFYPYSKCETFVLPFAVSHPDLSKLNILDVKNKYSIDKQYFFSPNQFFVHKNHIVVLEAVHELKEKEIIVNVLFSGKENDYRQPDYVKKLKIFINEHQLQDQVRFLGFIPREDQLMLMKHSIAIIQPSLFEGWSTVVEDVKALNKFIIVSDLPVHREQLNQNMAFFNPTDKLELAQKIKMIIDQKPEVSSFDYKNNVLNFARQFLNILNAN